MKYFQEIYLLPGAEITPYFIWQKLFQQIHLALVENKSHKNISKIGISFPEYKADEFLLGTKLRLFAPEKSALEKLQSEKWLTRLKDYLKCGEINPVPEKVERHACFRQMKPKGSKEKLARRRAKRHGETLEQALAHYDNYKEENCRLPYINMGSQSSGYNFRLFIERQEKEQPQKGVFSSYGLSRTTTVPLF